MSAQTRSLPRGRATRQVRRRLADNGIFVVFGVLVVTLAIVSPTFRTLDNLGNIGQQSAILGIAAFAMTLVIVCGSIDLSIGAVASAAGVLAAQRLAAGDPPIVAALAAVVAGGVFGLINGLVVAVGRVPSFIATLASFYVAQGVALALTSGQTIGFSAQSFRDVFATGDVLGLPSPLIWAIGVGACLAFVLHYTRLGADLFAIGGNAASSRLLGVAVDSRRIAVLTISGALMGLVGLILIARIGNARSDGAIGLEFDAIAAVVIGGTSFSGGRGSIARTTVGVLFVGVLNNALALFGVDYNTQQIIKGVLVVLAVLADRWAKAQNSP